MLLGFLATHKRDKTMSEMIRVTLKYRDTAKRNCIVNSTKVKKIWEKQEEKVESDNSYDNTLYLIYSRITTAVAFTNKWKYIM